jgi:energy-coupling factor transporter ATP-binding protein EcfA2
VTEPIVNITNLHYRYRGQKTFALDGIDLAVPKGEFLMIMGPSEAGKSTLAATINGLIPHFHNGKLEGDVVVIGQNTREKTVAQMSETVGMVFQDFEAQLFSTNVELEVAFGPENFAVDRPEIKHRIDMSGWKPSGGARPQRFQAGKSKSSPLLQSWPYTHRCW